LKAKIEFKWRLAASLKSRMESKRRQEAWWNGQARPKRRPAGQAVRKMVSPASPFLRDPKPLGRTLE